MQLSSTWPRPNCVFKSFCRVDLFYRNVLFRWYFVADSCVNSSIFIWSQMADKYFTRGWHKPWANAYAHIPEYMYWSFLHCIKRRVISIRSFSYRDNSVHLHECSPFWVGIFITFNKENYTCLLFYVGMCLLMNKAFLYVIGRSNIM